MTIPNRLIPLLPRQAGSNRTPLPIHKSFGLDIMSTTIEQQFVEAFITDDMKQRLMGFFRSRKARWKGLLELEHFHSGIIDARYAYPVSRSDSTVEGIVRLLRQRGAPSECYVFSNCKELDQQLMPLEQAIHEVHGIGIGTVVSLIPGRLAFYEGELYPNQFILERTPGFTDGRVGID